MSVLYFGHASGSTLDRESYKEKLGAPFTVNPDYGYHL